MLRGGQEVGGVQEELMMEPERSERDLAAAGGHMTTAGSETMTSSHLKVY